MTERTRALLKLSIVVLALFAAGLALRAEWGAPPTVKAQETTAPVPITTPSSPSPTPTTATSPPTTTTTTTSSPAANSPSPAPTPRRGDLFKAGGAAEGPVPPMPAGGGASVCPRLKNAACYAADRGE